MDTKVNRRYKGIIGDGLVTDVCGVVIRLGEFSCIPDAGLCARLWLLKDARTNNSDDSGD